MNRKSRTETLSRFIEHVEYPILWYVQHAATPAGETIALNSPCDPLLDRIGDLVGIVAGGRWSWNGKGTPRDFQGCVFSQLVCYADASLWRKLQD